MDDPLMVVYDGCSSGKVEPRALKLMVRNAQSTAYCSMRQNHSVSNISLRISVGAVVLWCLVAVVGVGQAAADLYRYKQPGGGVLVTTSERSDLELIEVIRDGGQSADGDSGSKKDSARKRRHKAARRTARTLRREAIARERTQPGESPGQSPRPTSLPRENRYDDIIKEASEAYQIPAPFIKGVIRVESNFNPHAVSHTGAMGLMQLMPATARYVGVEDPFDPRQNIFGGTKLLRMLTNKYNGDINLLLAAYNAGEGAVDKHDGIPYSATREYVRKVYHHYKQYQREEQAAKARQ